MKARYWHWATQALERINDAKQRDVIERYIRWHQVRRMNEMESVSNGPFLRSKQRVTVAINFVNWLTEHTIDLTVPPHRRGASKRLSINGQDRVLHTVLYTDDLSVCDRAAGILLLVFGQQIEDVVTMTWDAVTVTDDAVTVRICTTDIALPEPLDTPWRHLSTNPGNDQTAAHPNTQWVFRGYSPGRHIDASHLRDRLRRVFSTRAARQASCDTGPTRCNRNHDASVQGWPPSFTSTVRQGLASRPSRGGTSMSTPECSTVTSTCCAH